MSLDDIIKGITLTAAPCSLCNDAKVWADEDDDGNPLPVSEENPGSPCPECCPEKLTSEGLTYVAMGCHGGGVILETQCGILEQEASDCGSTIDSVGLDEPPDVGIWKAVVSYWGSKDYWGEYDSGYNVEGGWVEVESYPEPDCAKLGDGRCHGMLSPRNEDESVWACDEHAGEVS